MNNKSEPSFSLQLRGSNSLTVCSVSYAAFMSNGSPTQSCLHWFHEILEHISWKGLGTYPPVNRQQWDGYCSHWVYSDHIQMGSEQRRWCLGLFGPDHSPFLAVLSWNSGEQSTFKVFGSFVSTHLLYLVGFQNQMANLKKPWVLFFFIGNDTWTWTYRQTGNLWKILSQPPTTSMFFKAT